MTVLWAVLLVVNTNALSLPAPLPITAPTARASRFAAGPSPLATPALPTLPTFPPPPGGPPAASDLQLADSLLRRAAAQYDLGRLADALTLLQRAYGLARRPEILFNLAQVQRAQGACGDALDSYRRFLAETQPDHPERERARRRALEMQACLSPSTSPRADPSAGGPNADRAISALPASPPDLAVEAPAGARAHPRMRGAAWALLGAAVLSAGVCSYFAWRAAVDSDFSTVTFGDPEYQQRLRDGARAQRWARWSGAGAAVTGVTGGGLMLVSRPGPGRETAPRLGAVAGWMWHF